MLNIVNAFEFLKKHNNKTLPVRIDLPLELMKQNPGSEVTRASLLDRDRAHRYRYRSHRSVYVTLSGNEFHLEYDRDISMTSIYLSGDVNKLILNCKDVHFHIDMKHATDFQDRFKRFQIIDRYAGRHYIGDQELDYMDAGKYRTPPTYRWDVLLPKSGNVIHIYYPVPSNR
jgi:hypothetical protein